MNEFGNQKIDRNVVTLEKESFTMRQSDNQANDEDRTLQERIQLIRTQGCSRPDLVVLIEELSRLTLLLHASVVAGSSDDTAQQITRIEHRIDQIIDIMP